MDNDLVKQRKQVNVCVKRLSHETVNSLGCEAFEFVAKRAAFGPLRLLRILLSGGRLANVKHYRKAKIWRASKAYQKPGAYGCGAPWILVKLGGYPGHGHVHTIALLEWIG